LSEQGGASGLDIARALAVGKAAGVPAWDAGPVRRHVARSLSLLRGHAHLLIREAKWPVPDFRPETINKVFGNNGHEGHAFNAAPLNWGFVLTEPQVTRGLAHFLNAANTARRRRAFLTALGVEGPADDSRLAGGTVETEVATGNGGRIDLLMRWSDAQGTHGIVIEAKFGHNISQGQLPKYRNHIVYKIKNTSFFVIGLQRKKKDDKQFRRNKSWEYMTWRAVMHRFEVALSRESGGDSDPEFARFRRSVWSITS
jgi:hypothetical protein